MEDYRLEQTGPEVQNILNGAAMQVDLTAEVDRATDAEGRLQDNIDAEEQARRDADGLLQQGIDDEAQRAKDAEEANAGEIEGIKALIPATATSANKLADTNYVNSSIQTATAEYRGDYNVVTDLHLAIDATHAQIETLLPTVIAEADKNDYCYVMIPTNASTPTEIAKIERYKMTSEGWKFEYDVNNSTFTAEEWAAIKSGITSGLVAKLNSLPTNSDLLLLLAAKQDVLTFDSVPVPESNNPVKSGGVYSAIDDEKTARLNSDTAIHTELDGLQAKVPATASSDNKLVDQNQMNSSISTATATFRGDWNVVSDLHLAVDATRAQIAALLPTVISTADNNDYCYVEIPTSAETPEQIERVERYKFNGTAWAYEYTLNNSGFTAAQWAAINSMITSGLVAKLSSLPTNADLLAMLAQKQDNLTFDSTPTENSTNPVTSGGVFAADKAMSDAIEAILLLIPSAATSLNKLVDTALMNSSISTATATFRGTYNLVSNLGLGIDATEGQIAAALLANISTADNNDYAFVQIPTSAETPAQIARTDRYKFNGTAWGFEYTLNTSGFTAAQWAAINSTITSALVAKLNALPTASELQEALGVLTSGITTINQKIPSTASQSNKLVDNASMESYIAQVINILDASFNVTSTDGHITLHITQVDGVITSVQVQSTDIASAADLALKASQADLTALASRVTTAEGNITSLTGRIGTAETNIANLQQLYNDLQQSKPVPVTALPSTGQQGVIYRLAGTTSYSDYMWNGSSWVLMATYNNAIDDVPLLSSDNLVKSGGVAKSLNILNSEIYQQNVKAYYGYYVNNHNTGSRTPAVNTNNGILFFVEGGKSYKHNIPISSYLYGNILSLQVYDKSFNNLGHPDFSNGSYSISSQDAMYLLISVNTSKIADVTSIYLRENGNMYNELDGKITDTNDKINDINGILDTEWNERNLFGFNRGDVNLIDTNGVPFKLLNYTWAVNYLEVTEGKKYRLSGLIPSYLAVSGNYLTYSIVSNITVGADGKLVVNTSDVVQVGCTNNDFVNNYNSTIDITIPTGGKYIICSTGHAYQLCIDLDESSFKNIVCWGDSLTAQGWPTELQYLVGGHYNVVNRGIGGQDAATIAGRQGGSPFYLVSDVTLPADTSRVQLPIETIEGYTSLGIASKTNDYVHYTNRLLCQGDYFNNVNIDGIDCILTKDGDNIATAYYLQRAEAASESEVLKAGSILYGSYFKEARNTDISVVFIGQNGGYNSPETLVMQVKKMIGFTSCGSKFIAITSHGNGNQNIQEAFTNEFGSKVLNLQWYLPNYGIIDAVRFGLATASEMAGHTWDDGTLKPSDDVHLTALGYKVVANKVYEMMELLGYFD